MKEEIVIGALVSVISALAAALVKVYHDLKRSNAVIVDFAETILSKGDPYEVIKNFVEAVKGIQGLQNQSRRGNDNSCRGDEKP